MTQVAGIDAAQEGHYVLVLVDDRHLDRIEFHATFASLAQAASSASVRVINAPLGLGIAGERPCDLAAMRALPGQETRLAWSQLQVDRASEVRGSELRFHEGVAALSFFGMASSWMPPRRLLHAPETWAGLVERLELLHRERLRPERSMGGIGRASPEDVMDATALAWTAGRVADGTARRFPEQGDADALLWC